MLADTKRLTLIDLFAGAGGLAAGLERAGFRSLASVELNKDAISTLQQTKAARIKLPGQSRTTYLQHAKILRADISDLDSSNLLEVTKLMPGELTLLSGGPPCQPFSSAGKQRGIDDPRGRLFHDFVRIADHLQPCFILFENVRGIVTAKGPDGKPGAVLRLIQESFEAIGYACSFAVLNSADFGAPQRRVRLFMVASRTHDLPQFPSETHAKPIAQREIAGPKPWVSLREALECIDKPDESELVFPSGKRAQDLLALKPGTGLKSRGIVEANRPGGHWGYRQDSFVADLDLPARTIRAASTPDWIQDSEYGLRRLHWKECAFLQGFETSWQFVGSTASKFSQIGNAVEGTIASALGRSIASATLRPAKTSPASLPWPTYIRKRVRYTSMEHRVNGAHRAAAHANK